MGQKILVADDSITIQKVIGLTFASEDFELEMADNGDEALEKAKAAPPDLIIADTNMPGLSGYELCERIRATPELAHIPLILLTGTYEVYDEERAREVGASDHLTKPFESAVLIEKVKLLLNASASRPTAPAPEAANQSTPDTELTDVETIEAEPLSDEDFTTIEEAEPATTELTGEDIEPIEEIVSASSESVEQLEPIETVDTADDFGDLEPIPAEAESESAAEAAASGAESGDAWNFEGFDAHPAADSATEAPGDTTTSTGEDTFGDIAEAAPIEDIEEFSDIEPIETIEEVELTEEEPAAEEAPATAEAATQELDFSDVALEDVESTTAQSEEETEITGAETPEMHASAEAHGEGNESESDEVFAEFAAMEEMEEEATVAAEAGGETESQQAAAEAGDPFTEFATIADHDDTSEPGDTAAEAPASAAGDPFAEFAAMHSEDETGETSVQGEDNADVFAEFAALEAEESQQAEASSEPEQQVATGVEELVVEAPDADEAIGAGLDETEPLDVAVDASPGELAGEDATAQLETTLEQTEEPALPVEDEHLPREGAEVAPPQVTVPREQIERLVQQSVAEAIERALDDRMREHIERTVEEIVRESLSRALEQLRGKLD